MLENSNKIWLMVKESFTETMEKLSKVNGSVINKFNEINN